MFQWMSGHTLRDKICNEDIRKGLEFANIKETMKENRSKWFEHVQRWGISEQVKKVNSWS